MLLGFILGGILEDNLRRAITLADGQWSFLWDRPSTVILMILTFLVLISPVIQRYISK